MIEITQAIEENNITLKSVVEYQYCMILKLGGYEHVDLSVGEEQKKYGGNSEEVYPLHSRGQKSIWNDLILESTSPLQR